jgi:hypothetical protein
MIANHGSMETSLEIRMRAWRPRLPSPRHIAYLLLALETPRQRLTLFMADVPVRARRRIPQRQSQSLPPKKQTL